MTIAHVTPTYPPYRGGMGAVANEYATRLRRRGHDVHVFAPQGREADDDNSKLHRLRGVAVGNASVVPSLYRRLRGFDVVHLHYPFFGGAEYVIARKLRQAHQRLIVSYYMDASAAGLKGALFDAYARLVLPQVVARADRILVGSLDYARTSALARFPGLVDRLEEHPYGVDLERFHPGREPALRAQWAIADNEPLLVFVGTLDAAHHFKGLPQLFEALGSLGADPWRLIIVGDGPRRQAFEQMARDRGLASRVSFAGSVDDGLLPRYYRAADIHVLPSTGKAEAFGLVSIEAAASGIPSIVSRLPGVRSVVLDGHTGLHVTPGDAGSLAQAIARLLRDPGLRADLGGRARARAEREFAWEPLIDRLEATYARACRGAE